MISTAYIKILCFIVVNLFYNNYSFSQIANRKSTSFVAGVNADIFGKASSFIENVGQYGKLIPGHPELGEILYGYEGLTMPVLFTEKGIVFLQRKSNENSKAELEKLEAEGLCDEQEKLKLLYIDRIITMEWRNSNQNPIIASQNPLPAFHTYGLIKQKAKSYNKITYKNVYPGIDIIYSFDVERRGFDYSFLVHPGADINAISIQFGGDTKEVKIDSAGNILIASDISSFTQSAPVSFYQDSVYISSTQKKKEQKIISRFKLAGNIVHFLIKEYDRSKTIIIDPFVSSTGNLTGRNAGIAKDIDFDYAGNIYVSGGGDLSAGQLAKYGSTGNLLWTFSGKLMNPNWTFGGNYGGWVVEKSTGKTYLGQGGRAGFQIIRLDALGVYDNYLTPGNPNFLENWKMVWNCDGGTPKILIAGGGTSDNINLGICIPPSTILTSLNITGQPGGHQDISDMVIDPKTNELFSIFSQDYLPVITESNRLYKHETPYTATSKTWTRPSGYKVLLERANRPYLGPGLNDNSVNMLALNSNYLFYYDGLNLKAMNKGTGNDLGNGITFSNNKHLMQGGIVADECNNVYIGSSNGIIKVYKFTGSVFDDAASPDIPIPGFGNAIYDLVFDDSKKLLYASGNGFVASIDVAPFCAATVYTVKVNSDCSSRTATASINPGLPSGSTITYNLYNGTSLVSSNINGVFNNLDTTVLYTLNGLIDKECGGTQAIATFKLSNCKPNIGNGSPGIYVPSAFTPNSDGLNDVLKAIPYGIKEFKYFSLYNRWGELVFKTTNFSKGWNGIFRGHVQDTGVYAWIAEGIDVNDKTLRSHGTTILIR